MGYKPPMLYLFAGPNGAGKTTYARSFLRNEAHCLHFLNADYLAQGLSPLAPELAAVEAGKLLIRKIQECLDRKIPLQSNPPSVAPPSHNACYRHIPRLSNIFVLFLAAGC
jgi:predicted ABC-type ATPase